MIGMEKYHVEKEYKVKISASQYQRLLNTLPIKATLKQTNYYYKAKKDMGIRIREVDGKYTFTLKHYDGKEVKEFEFPIKERSLKDERIQDLLKAFAINTRYLGKMINTRANVEYPKAILSLDKSEYLGKVDYELEYELKDSKIDDIDNLKEILKMMNIECVFSDSTKYERFNAALTAKAAIFCADGLEECEALMTMDLLKRGGIYVDLVSVEDHLEITSSHNLHFRCDKYFEDIDKDDYDVLILPGGIKGTQTLSVNFQLIELLKKYKENDKLIAAICAAPSIFVKNGLVEDGKFTVYPGFESGLTSSRKKAYVDGNVITARGVGAVIDFAYAIIFCLLDEETADKVLEEIQYQ